MRNLSATTPMGRANITRAKAQEITSNARLIARYPIPPDTWLTCGNTTASSSGRSLDSTSGVILLLFTPSVWESAPITATASSSDETVAAASASCAITFSVAGVVSSASPAWLEPSFSSGFTWVSVLLVGVISAIEGSVAMSIKDPCCSRRFTGPPTSSPSATAAFVSDISPSPGNIEAECTLMRSGTVHRRCLICLSFPQVHGLLIVGYTLLLFDYCFLLTISSPSFIVFLRPIMSISR